MLLGRVSASVDELCLVCVGLSSWHLIPEEGRGYVSLPCRRGAWECSKVAELRRRRGCSVVVGSHAVCCI